MRRVFVLLAVCSVALAGAVGAEAQTIQEIQEAIAAAGAHWTAGDNEAWQRYAVEGQRLSDVDFALLNSVGDVFQPLGMKDLPATLDWRNMNGKNYVTPVKDQGQCGACWAFATVGPIESHIAIAEKLNNPQIDLSEQELLSCCTLPGCEQGCSGGFTTSSYDFARDTGLFDEACLPYRHNDTIPCDTRCSDWQKRVYKIDSWAFVGPGMQGFFPTSAEIMEALQQGPLGTSMIVYKDFESYTGGIYTTVVGTYEGMHAVTIIGYNSDQQYWICKNSWGTGWGEDGFFEIAWGAGEIGMFTILPQYTSDGPPPSDDDNDDNDNDNDNDVADDDSAHVGGNNHTTTTKTLGCQ
jgi:hypothetical protein